MAQGGGIRRRFGRLSVCGHFENDSTNLLRFLGPVFWKRFDFDFKNDSIMPFFALKTTRFCKGLKMRCNLR
jgi:hypothetical protein